MNPPHVTPPAYVVEDKGFNHLPLPHKPISVDQFNSALFLLFSLQSPPPDLEFRQVSLKPGNPSLPLHQTIIYWGQTHALAVVRFTHPPVSVGLYPPDSHLHYRIGCNHEWLSISAPTPPRSGMHTDRCKICGLEITYDTSD